VTKYAQPGYGVTKQHDSSFLKQQNLHSKNNQDAEDFFSETTSVADSMQTEADSIETDSVTTDSTETETENLIDVLEEAEWI
jgi:hypothetical protein